MDSPADRWLRNYEANNPQTVAAYRQPPRNPPPPEAPLFSSRLATDPTTHAPIPASATPGETHGSQDIHALLQAAIRLRRSRGDTQAAFAYRLGVNVRTWQEWEQGRRRPSGPARTLLERGLKELGPGRPG
ncbi:helix-turn-helix domain-containing protein [Halomonas ventosae]|uniref:Helix-turn-helix protein n=1 Tax=Halomonas ventosae TaxID=229007 RepID=A0A4R6HPS7_9GAMM|nr:helix-turn-helix protein [Halomonas ventosae]